jgi:hypothetical protein
MEQRRYPSVTDSLERSAKDLGDGFRRVPHIKFGNSEERIERRRKDSKPVRIKKPSNSNPSSEIDRDPKQPKIPIHNYDPVMDNFRKWMLWILTGLIGGLAVILIIWRILSRIF